MPALKTVRGAVPGSLAIPKFDNADAISWTVDGNQTEGRPRHRLYRPLQTAAGRDSRQRTYPWRSLKAEN